MSLYIAFIKEPFEKIVWFFYKIPSKFYSLPKIPLLILQFIVANKESML